MNKKLRIKNAMHWQVPDRVPVMSQLSIGHYFLYANPTPFDIWFTTGGFTEALVELAEQYDFDGILVNLPGRDPDIERYIDSVEEKDTEDIVRWKDGSYTVVPHDDNPQYFTKAGDKPSVSFDLINPDDLFYVEPWDVTEINYPYTWGFESEVRSRNNYFPEYHLDALKTVLNSCGNTLSVHSEVFSPWSQFLELLQYQNGLMAIMQDPVKAKECLERLTEGAIALATKEASLGVDAVLISSAFAGAGLISRDHYSEFVLPYERKLIQTFREVSDTPIYTHTCGAIGDRLDLLLESGTEGIDTLDPPPIGTVELDKAKEEIGTAAFIKGNIDPINTLLNGSPDTITEDVKWRLETGKPGGGFILSSACSVAPHTPPAHLELLAQLSEEYGRYSE